MTADSAPGWGFDTANMLSVKVLVALRYKVAALYLISMEGINEGRTHIIIVQFIYRPVLDDKKSSGRARLTTKP